MLNNIDLVTVTYSQDRGIQMLQSYSVNLMVTEPCNHYVIVEDNNISIEEWHALLSPYYTQHTLHLISGRELLSEEYYINDSHIKNGWHRSAVLKLLIAEKIQSDKYLILDSKNIFICKQILNNWRLLEGNGLPVDRTKRTYNGKPIWPEVDDFCIKNSIRKPDKVYDSATPFMMFTDVVKKVIEFDFLPLFFNKKNWWSSELYLYSVLSQHYGNNLKSDPVPNVTFWNTERPLTKDVLTDIFTWPNMRTIGMHRDVLKLNINLTEFTDFLAVIGFDKQIVEHTLTCYEKDTKNYEK